MCSSSLQPRRHLRARTETLGAPHRFWQMYAPEFYECGKMRLTCFPQFIFTPISVISFILSLFVVERQHRQWRHQQNHASPSQAQSGRWLSSPEPYQDAKGATWHPRLSLRRRGIAKMHMHDVLEMKGRVVLGIAVWMAIGVLAIAYGARRMYCWAFVA